MNIAFPYHIDKQGRTARSDMDAHIKDLLLMLLMTNPGERVNRPDFGGGLPAMVFSGNRPDLQITLKFTCQGLILQTMGNLIDLKDLQVIVEGESLFVEVRYAPRQTNADTTLTIPLNA